MANVQDVARYMSSMGKVSSPYSVNARKLQKLLYFAQGYHLVYTEGIPLFDEDMFHCEGGPECVSVRNMYESHGWLPISYDMDVSELGFTPDEELIMRYVFQEFGDIDGKSLEELVFQEDTLLDTGIGDLITVESMLMYFREWHGTELLRSQNGRV